MRCPRFVPLLLALAGSLAGGGAALAQAPPAPARGGRDGPAASDEAAAGALDLYARASLLLHREDHQGALAALDDLLARHPDTPLAPEARYWRAQCLDRLGRTADAREALADLVARHPDSGWAEDARERLAAAPTRDDAGGYDVLLANGERFTAHVRRVEPDAVFLEGGRFERLAWTDVERIVARNAAGTDFLVLLRNGDRLSGRLVRLEGGAIELAGRGYGRVSVPRGALLHVGPASDHLFTLPVPVPDGGALGLEAHAPLLDGGLWVEGGVPEAGVGAWVTEVDGERGGERGARVVLRRRTDGDGEDEEEVEVELEDGRVRVLRNGREVELRDLPRELRDWIERAIDRAGDRARSDEGDRGTERVLEDVLRELMERQGELRERAEEHRRRFFEEHGERDGMERDGDDRRGARGIIERWRELLRGHRDGRHDETCEDCGDGGCECDGEACECEGCREHGRDRDRRDGPRDERRRSFFFRHDGEGPPDGEPRDRFFLFRRDGEEGPGGGPGTFQLHLDGDGPAGPWERIHAELAETMMLGTHERGRTDRVFLENGDTLSGDVLTLDAEHLRMRTSYGEVQIDRQHVMRVVFRQRARPFLGLSCDDVPGGGVSLQRVYDGTGAARAGLQVGDVLLTFGGQAVRDTGHLVELVQARRVGDVVRVTVRRGEQTLEVDVTLGEAAPVRVPLPPVPPPPPGPPGVPHPPPGPPSPPPRGSSGGGGQHF